jgi:zinc/manganese transport system substrate-binding protein
MINSTIKIILFLLLIQISSLVKADLNIFTCEPEWQALAQELGGDKVSTFSATNGLQDPHFIQARPSLIAKVRNADLLVCSGAELEAGWLPLLLRKSGNNQIQPGQSGYFLATSSVLLMDKPLSIDRSQGDVHASGNPHIQTDPRRIAKVAEDLSLRMQQLDSVNALIYQQQTDEFLIKWKQAIEKWQIQAKKLENKKIIAQHKSWVYFADWLKLDIIAYLEPKPGVAPTAEHLSQLIKVSESQSPKMVIRAAYQNPKSAKWFENKTGIKVVELPFTVGGNSQSENLFSLFDDSITRLIGALE